MQQYTVVRLDSEPATPTQYVARFAAIFTVGSITQAMISDMLKEYTDNGGDLEFDGTKKELDDLDFDVMFVKATINAHQIS
jgi:hypothetical protein